MDTKALVQGNEMSTKLKYDGFDIIKLIMAIFVVCIHTGFAEAVSSEKWIRPLFDTAVPFFFMTSSFLLFEKIENSNISPRNVFNRYLLHFVKLYCIWSFVYFPFAVCYYVTTKTSIAVAVFDYLRGFFLIGQHYYSFQLWYLLSTILGVAVLRILYKKVSDKVLFCTAVIVYVISEALTYLADNLELYTGIIYKFGRLVQLTIGDGLVLSGFFWLALGALLHSHKKALAALSVTGGGIA